MVKLVYRPVLWWAARRGLVGRTRHAGHPQAGRFTKADVDEVLGRTWQLYDELRPGVPRVSGVGPQMNVHLAAITLGFQRALVERGVEPDEATGLTSDCAWVVYARWAQIARFIARRRSPDPARRLAIGIDAFLRFPFSQPGYRWRRASPRPGTEIVDIQHCPVADYLVAQGAGDLCLDTWCNQDFALAEVWGAHLKRSQTIAMGASHCDFCFIADQSAGSRPEEPGAAKAG
jgi:ubiquinone biosynthesis protein